MNRALAAGGPALLLLAALAPISRGPAAIGIALGWAILRLGRRPEAIAWAAVLPVAAAIASPAVLGSDAPLGAAGCVDPLSVIAVRRLVLAGAILALIAFLAVVHGSDARELGLVRPAPREALAGISGCAVLVVAGLWIGPLVAMPFFGQLSFATPAAALVPAVLFGLANGVLEEIEYRGAMQGWLGRIAPAWAAIAYQGLLFGIVHAGPEVVSLLPLHVGLLAAVGVAGGVVRARTGNLAIPIGIHVGADIALYVGLACRTAAA